MPTRDILFEVDAGDILFIRLAPDEEARLVDVTQPAIRSVGNRNAGLAVVKCRL